MRLVLAVFLLAACGLVFAACGPGEENNGGGPVCESVESADFEGGGFGSDYCEVPTDLGCFPYHKSSDEQCGPFETMRTSSNSGEQIDACESLLTKLNCGTYADEADTSLSFFVDDAAQLSVTVQGTYQGQDVDTTFYFNPCHQNCQAAITLETIEPDQQKLCEIPSQKAECLFDESAHSVTLVRADETSMVIRTAGEETALSRVDDE